MQNMIKFKCFLIMIVAVQQILAKQQLIIAEDGRKYLLEREEKFNWFEASLQCISRSLRLAVIDNESKNNALVKTLKAGGINRIWINGVLSSVSGQHRFYWFNTGAEFDFTFWKPNEPNGNGEEHCVHMDWTDYRWNDNNCVRNKLGYICEEY